MRKYDRRHPSHADGLWPEPMNGCSRCGARRPTEVDYFCRAVVGWRDGAVYCDALADVVLIRTNEGRCANHIPAPDDIPGRFRNHERIAS